MSTQDAQKQVNQAASDVQKTASKVASDVQNTDVGKKASEAVDEASKQGNSLLEQGTKLASDTIAYAQQQVQGILGSAKKTDVEGAANDASKQVSEVTEKAAKEGQATAESTQQTLGDLAQQARTLVGDVLNSANEYIKPQQKSGEAQEAANSYLDSIRNTASNAVDQAAHIISGKDAQSLASDVQKTAEDTSAQAQSKAQELTK